MDKCLHCKPHPLMGSPVYGCKCNCHNPTQPSTPLPDSQGITPAHLQNLGNIVSTPLDDLRNELTNGIAGGQAKRDDDTLLARAAPLDDEEPNTIVWAADDAIKAIILGLVNHIEKNYGERYLTLASKEVEQAKTKLDQAYAKQFLELPEMQDIDVSAWEINSYGWQQAICENQVKAIIRAAVNKMVGAQDE